jgi:hypothetical protein
MRVKPNESHVIVITTNEKKENQAQNLFVQSMSNNHLMKVQKKTNAHGI